MHLQQQMNQATNVENWKHIIGRIGIIKVGLNRILIPPHTNNTLIVRLAHKHDTVESVLKDRPIDHKHMVSQGQVVFGDRLNYVEI